MVNTELPKTREHMTFLEEVENDVSQTSLLLDRLQDPDISVEERRGIDTFKRVLTVIDKGGLSVSDGHDGHNVVSASNNSLPSPSYLAHGSRVLIQIPPVGEDNKSPHEFMNWLIRDDKDKKFIASQADKNNPLFQRSVSSHSTHQKGLKNSGVL